MIAAANPISVVNAYKVNYDYFKVGAARHVAGVQQETPRQQPQTFPFLRSAYHQAAQTEASGLSTLLKSAQGASQAAQDLLSQSPGSVLDQRVTVSSKPDKLKAQVKSGAAIQNFGVKISTVAAEQQNTSIPTVRASASLVQSGWNEFSLQQHGETSVIKVFISSAETNGQALGKIKNALNEQAGGVKASVVDEGGGLSRLKISSSHTGSKQIFTLQDMSGNAVASLGLNQTERSAANAVYSVNGGAVQSSESNDILLDHGNVKLTLLRTDNEPISIATRADSEAIAASIKQLVRGYNQFRQHLHSAPGHLNRTIVQSLEHAASPHTLKQLGLTEKADGTLLFDETELTKQVSEHYDDVKQSLSGPSGLASSLSRSLSQLEQTPAQMLLNLDGSALKPYSLYQSRLQAYLPLPMNGLLLDRVM